MAQQIFQYHPIFGYHFIPNLKIRLEHESGGYLVRVNSAGFRSEREFREERSRKHRILLFGDSFTAGDGVSNKHRFGDLLETLVPDLEVYNFGLPGTGTDQHYLVFRELARNFPADLVVVAVQVENIRRVGASHRLSLDSEGTDVLIAKPYFDLEADGTISLKNVPVPKEPLDPDRIQGDDSALVDRGGRMPWLRKAVNKMGGRAKDLAQRVSQYQPLPEYDDAKGREWRLMKAILERWAGETDTPLLVMPVPLYHYVEETASPEGYLARFAELEGSKNMTLHDPMPDYRAVPKSDRRSLRFEKDIHPTPAHHRLLAESLAGAVKRQLSVLEAKVGASHQQ